MKNEQVKQICACGTALRCCDQRQLASTKSAESSVRVSPDGKYVFFSTEESGNRQVWRMNADGTDRKQLTSGVGGYPLTVTTDGRFVFYESTLDSYVYRVAASGGEEVPIYNEKRLFNPSVSPDGASVAYLFNDAMVRKIGILDLNSRQNRRVVELGAREQATRHFAWSADSKVLFYVTATPAGHTLWRQPLSDEPPERVAELGPGDVAAISSPENGNLAYIIGRWRYDVMLLRGLG